MKNKLLVLLLLCIACAHPGQGRFKSRTAICTQDGQFYYEKNKVESLTVLGVYPPSYEIKYLDGATELYYGSCHMAN